MSRLLTIAGPCLAAAAVAIPFTAALAQEEREIVIQRVVVDEKGDKDTKEEKEDKDDDDDGEKKAAYWIGIALDGPGSADGLKIAEVYPDSPALKAELKAGDVLVAVGDQKLEHVDQLVDAVQDSKGQELKIKLLREGKEMVREVKPGKRPGADAIERINEARRQASEKGEKEAKEEEANPGQPDASPRTFGRIFRIERAPDAAGAAPRATGSGGSAYPPAAPTAMPRMATSPQTQLPDDMEVTISKKGNKPAVVTARQGDKLWKTTENELGMLPPQAQAYATRMLGKDMRARLPGPGASGMSGGMGMPGMAGMPATGGGMSGMPGMAGGMPGMALRRAIEVRMGKDGKLEAIEDGKPVPNVNILPGGGIRLKNQDGKEEKQKGKDETKEGQPAEKDDPAREERIRSLQKQAEALREMLDKLREQAKEKK